MKDESEAARFKSLVTMYENMKAKDAAKIFDRLDMQGAGRGREPRSIRAACRTSWRR